MHPKEHMPRKHDSAQTATPATSFYELSLSEFAFNIDEETPKTPQQCDRSPTKRPD
jgi:hypothetical protein